MGYQEPGVGNESVLKLLVVSLSLLTNAQFLLES